MTTPTTVQVRFQFRADTAANWTSIDPVLLANELGRETDTGKIKIGDGTTAWSSLAYQGWSTLTYPLVNADIASDAAIDHSKLADITAGSVLLGNASDVPTATALSGDVTVNSSGVTAISAGAIVDADVSASAEIAVSKLANGTANQILTTDGTDVTWTDNPTIAGNVIISGNLTVNGTETIINVDTLQVEDKTIEMGVVATPTDLTADGGGIVLKGTTDKTITWSDTTDAWTSSEPLDLPAGAEATPALFFGGDVNSGLYSPGADQVAISTGGTTRLFIDSSGRLLVGTDSAIGVGSSNFASLQVEGTSGARSRFTVLRRQDNAFGAAIGLGKARGSSNELVSSDDVLGTIEFAGGDGVDLLSTAGSIECFVDGTPGANQMPGRIVFSTNPGTTSATPQARMTILSDGKVGINTTTPRGLLDLGPGTGDGTLSDTPSEYQLILNANQSTTGDYARNIAFVNTTFDVSAAINCYDAGSGVSNGLSFATAISGTLSEKLRITHTGNVGIANTAPDYELDVTGSIRASVQGRFGAGTNTAPAYSFSADSDTGMYRNTTNSIAFATGGTAQVIISDSGTLRPGTDNTQLLGSSTIRWSTVYAGTGTINTSDATLKQDIENLDAAELAVATAIKGLIKKYRFTDAVNAKGDDARIHVGVIAQEVEQAFLDAGLDASRYALFCRDTWYELDGSPFDSEDNEVTADTPGAVEKTRLGIRYSELLAFVIAAM